MMFQKISVIFLIAMVCLVASSVMAEDCFDDSPNLISLGDDYFNLDQFIELSKQERQELDELFESMRGKWQGSLNLTECLGHKSKYETYNNTAEVDVEVKLSRGDRSYVKMTADANFRKDRISKRIRRQPTRQGKIFLYEKVGGGLRFIEKYRLFVGTGAAMVEDVYVISTSRKSIKMNFKSYHGGVFVLEEQWVLSGR